MRNKRFTPAFSMLELVFVIVILGIVASMGSEMIVKVYEQYILQRAQYKASMKTELAATQIANRLASAIPGTVYRIRTNDALPLELIDSNFPPGIDGDDYNGIQWVGSDIESFTASFTPGWSGFCDVNASISPNLSTPGSALGSSDTIINNLSNRALAPILYFPNDPTGYTTNTPLAGTTIGLTGSLPTRIYEHYKLAWSSYAVRVEGGDLRLYYDFAATPAASRTNAPSSLLMTNISTFKFQGAGGTIRFKLCREEDIGEDFNITVCKEKAVF